MKRRLPVAVLVLLSGLGAASCAGADQVGSPAHRMSVWVGGTGFGEDIGTLVADNARIPKDVPNGTGAVHAACATLVNDAQMANGELPTPDSQVSDLLTSAYVLEVTAGNDCFSAGSTDKKLLATAERDTARAEALYVRALARIRSIDGRVVSTTTTTDNAPTGIFG